MPPDKSVHERALRHIVDVVAQSRNASADAVYLADVAAVALGDADPTPHDEATWLDPLSRERKP